MDVNCEGCAGCCVDWREIASTASDHERRGRYEPLDDVYNLVALSRDDVRAFLEAGLADALTPRLWSADGSGDSDADGSSDEDVDRAGNGKRVVTVGGVELAAIGGRPAFFVGLRKPPKPVGPFDTEPTWLSTCVFLDPTTLQCRIHQTEHYPTECAEYPGHNLSLDVETECERVEATFGGERLLDATVPDGLSAPLFGPQALGGKVFAHPEPERLDGVVERAVDGALTDADRAEFVAVALAHSPGSTAINEAVYEESVEHALRAESWAGQAIDDWHRAAADGSSPNPAMANRIEDERGAPDTSGWS